MKQGQQIALELYETIVAQRGAFLINCRKLARELALKTGDGVITIDEVRKVCPLPNGIDGRIYGAVFTRDDWQAVSLTSTTVKSSHGRPIRKFVYKRHPNYSQINWAD